MKRAVLTAILLAGATTALAGQTVPGPPDLPANGTRAFSVVQYDYLDDGGRLTEMEILEAFLLGDVSVRTFYREASFDMLDFDVSLSIEAVTDLHPPVNGCYPGQSWVLIEVDEELEPDPVWLDIDQHLGLVHNDCTFNVSSVGNSTGWPTLAQGTVYLPVSRVTAKPVPDGLSDFAGLGSSTWAHEVGHGLGIPFHPQTYACPVNGPLSENPDDCVNASTHQHDLMGSRHAGTHLNAHLKEWLGWLPAANKLTIETDGCHLVDLHDLAQPAAPSEIQLLEIPLSDPVPARTAGGADIDFDALTLEFRGHTGFDARPFKQVPLAAGGFRNVTAEVNAFGALIQALNCDDLAEPWHPCTPYELDMKPGTMTDTNLPDFWDPIDAYLLAGQAWTVPRNPVTIEVVDTADAPDSIRLSIDFGTAGDLWYSDSDGDGFGDPGVTVTACLAPAGFIATDGDCDDTNADTYPGAVEVNDGQDNQCPGDPGHGAVDETSGTSGFNDPGDRTRYSWSAQQGATAYEVARSTQADFSSDCTIVPTSQPFWDDPGAPGPGVAFHYLNRPVAPFSGSWGRGSGGTERTVCP